MSFYLKQQVKIQQDIPNPLYRTPVRLGANLRKTRVQISQVLTVTSVNSDSKSAFLWQSLFDDS